MTTTSVIVAGARTPIGKFNGALKDFSATDLAGFAIKAALERAGISGVDVDYVILGQVLQAGNGQAPARQAAIKGGIPLSVASLLINKVCLSGLDAIALADQLIRAGEFETVVAGGMESMTKAPHLLLDSRAGYKFGDVTIRDHMIYDGLLCAIDHVLMGEATDKYNERYGLTRAEQDAISLLSHQRAVAAQRDGIFDDEIIPVSIPQRKGEPILFSKDEGIRPETTMESLGALKPAFSSGGTITAGSSSQISDAAAAVVVMSKDKAVSLGLSWLAEIGAHGVVAGPDTSLHEQPANAIKKAMDREGITASDLDIVEINEAFAAVSLVSARELGIDSAKVNPHGGAIALGHPVGMSGARMALHVAYELKRKGSGYGVAALCGGGGQGDALILRA
ncbi:MAG TPA: acetyl-CoA C-acetyltransferase [Candidatus Nanopelagicaceae bacterium]|nr:acetyl-CoA C-acetyltransferase [Candidatus Nanopelagicaceae bacterium]